jgi:hypothetical protein
LCRIGRDARGRRPLREQITLEIGLEHFVVVLRGAQIEIRRHGGLLCLGIAQLDEHGIGLDRSAGQHDDTLDGAVGERGDPANLIGHQHAGAAHVAQHRSALDGLNPQPAGLDGRRGRLQARESHGCDQDQERRRNARNNAISLSALRDFRGTSNIHLEFLAQELCQRATRKPKDFRASI